MNGNTVSVQVVGGPQAQVPWTQGMNAQQAMEEAFDQINNTEVFTYGLQYYGPGLGYLVFMINETYDTYMSTSSPYYYWEFLVNGVPASVGIDQTILSSGDQIQFSFVQYVPALQQDSLLRAKHELRIGARKPK